MGDWAWTHSQHDVNPGTLMPFFNCAQQIEDFKMKEGNYSKVIWFLVSDHLFVRRFAVEKYGRTSDKI